MTDPTMTKTVALLPCPLHGGTALLESKSLDERMGYNTVYTISVACCSLTMSGESKRNENGWQDDPLGQGRGELIAAWNTRTQTDQQLREALELCLKRLVAHPDRTTLDIQAIDQARSSLSSSSLTK